MAKLLVRRKNISPDGSLVDVVVWGVLESEKYPEGVRYRLAYIAKRGRRPAVLYDNHYPKGHHRHIGATEMPYHYQNIDNLFKDFENDIREAGREDF